MDSKARRKRILQILGKEGVVKGSSLASRLGVTRQVVVQDVAILRAEGERIMATPQGYAILKDIDAAQSGIVRLLAVKHDRAHTKDELYTMVDLGFEVLDVVVEHPVYGQLTGLLSLSSRRDVDDFMEKMDETKAGLLSSLTNGVHLHTVRGRDKAGIEALLKILKEKGYLLTG